ncbi:hypothetical protein CO731_01895 [Aminobacter sp. MSH1]|uniref:hypothetical protein n=1 Tax=Aminobacter sp. MSH1 TaxID=374606 RepID=UPI000D35A509|nr:hypothetical protein [Aminobacter sp. MSH1]AWC22437.1 hypothetical protein CO731_01895 [Aminobacter sp. MSH1]
MAESAGEIGKPQRPAAACKPKSARPSIVFQFLQWLASKSHHTRRIDGVWVLASEMANLERVETALNLIREHDPVRHGRLIRDLEQIWVWAIPGSVGRFRHLGWTCDLDKQFVETTAPDLIASVIVHEATHARLFRMGIGYEEAIRERVEQICLRRELAFARKFPNEIAVQWAEASLHSLPDLSDERFAQRRGEDYRALFLRNGVPRWLVSFVIVTGSWIHRRRQKKSAGTP